MQERIAKSYGGKFNKSSTFWDMRDPISSPMQDGAHSTIDNSLWWSSSGGESDLDVVECPTKISAACGHAPCPWDQ